MINGKRMMEAIGHVIYAAADSSSATQMMGVYFEGGENKIKLVALDGHTEDTAVHALLQAFLDRIYETSQFGIGVVAEKDNKDLDERMNAAAGFDGENMW